MFSLLRPSQASHCSHKMARLMKPQRPLHAPGLVTPARKLRLEGLSPTAQCPAYDAKMPLAFQQLSRTTGGTPLAGGCRVCLCWDFCKPAGRNSVTARSRKQAGKQESRRACCLYVWVGLAMYCLGKCAVAQERQNMRGVCDAACAVTSIAQVVISQECGCDAADAGFSHLMCRLMLDFHTSCSSRCIQHIV